MDAGQITALFGGLAAVLTAFATLVVSIKGLRATRSAVERAAEAEGAASATARSIGLVRHDSPEGWSWSEPQTARTRTDR